MVFETGLGTSAGARIMPGARAGAGMAFGAGVESAARMESWTDMDASSGVGTNLDSIWRLGAGAGEFNLQCIYQT